MITAAAMNLTMFSAIVISFALLIRLFGARRPAARATSARLLAVFGVFAFLGLYIWLALGPEIDRRLAEGPSAVVPGAFGEAGLPLDV